MKLSKINETHKNMETTVYPVVTDFGPPRRRPGRMLVKPQSIARAVYVGPQIRRPNRYDPARPDWKSVHGGKR